MCSGVCIRNLCLVTLLYGVTGLTKQPTDEFLLRFEGSYLTAVKTELAKLNVTFVKQILPGTYMFRDDETTNAIPEVIQQNEDLKGKVSWFERVLEYTVDLWTQTSERSLKAQPRDGNTIYKVSTFYDMGVEDAWRLNYTGRGVVIGVTDVGVDTDLEDLKANIDATLSYNAVDDDRSSDVTPEEFDDYDQTLHITDHGNRCVGMIAAMKNGECGDGVAYEAKIAVLRIFNASFDPLNSDHPNGQTHFRYARMAEGIAHAIPTVDIYSNSWGTVEDFEPRDALVTDAIKSGVKQGRGGKGAIHVFPVGSLADPYANSIFTIAVNSMGKDGSPATFSSACACTLTSAYGKGCDDLTDCDTSRMLTTSRLRGCTLEFEGTSASTAIVSGIAALALQANPNLGWREIQHIMVEASGQQQDTADNSNWLKNGAGKMYHPVLGFGLLNATKVVSLAASMTPLSNQLVMVTAPITMRDEAQKNIHVATWALTCTSELCIKSLEHVVVAVNFTTPKVYQSTMTLVSPAGTKSQIMDKRQTSGTGSTTHVNVEFLSVNFWGEQANGTWSLSLTNQVGTADSITIQSVQLRVYGTGTGANVSPSSYPSYDVISADGANTSNASSKPHSQEAAKRDGGSPTVAIYFVGLFCVAALIFGVGFREMIKVRTRNQQYASVRL